MTELDLGGTASRRRVLAAGGGLLGTMLVPGLAGAATAARPNRAAAARSQHTRLPVDEIQEIVGAEGTVSHGVLSISIAREDIGDVAGPLGVVLTPAFQIHGDLHFQPLRDGSALLNGDLALLTEETNPFIAAVLENELVWQAFHQHLVGLDPPIWFVHFRGVDDPLRLARAVRRAIDVTATPLPQTSPAHPMTPLDPDRLAHILHGEAEVGDEGVVTVTVNRKQGVRLGRVHAWPETGISTSIEFKPLGGSNAAVVPDFAMTADEIQPVARLMIAQGWFQGCLYNQETDEHPQLYFDHMLKIGDAYALAAEIRRGLNLTASE